MRPILLQGHTRPLTMVRFNREGDLLFTCAKDGAVCLWYSRNGEMLGTYQGHNGVVWALDISEDSSRLITAGGDNTAKLWETRTGNLIHNFPHRNAVRFVQFSIGQTHALVVTDARMHFLCQLIVYELSKNGEPQTDTPVCSMEIPGSRITVAVWGPLNEYIITGHEDGHISIWDWKNEEVLKTIPAHEGPITDMQMCLDKSYFITSSKDHTAKLWDSRTLNQLKKYTTERPLNSASMSSLKDHVILGGGQEASQVTTTSSRQGKFEVKFYHKIFEEEIGRVKGHFGPINTVAFFPNGRGFASGGEEGYVRLHHFDDDYYNFEIEYTQ